jgi:hypothetical protein
MNINFKVRSATIIADKRQKKIAVQCTATFMAGALGFEPRTNGFGDHYSTVEPYP